MKTLFPFSLILILTLANTSFCQSDSVIKFDDIDAASQMEILNTNRHLSNKIKSKWKNTHPLERRRFLKKHAGLSRKSRSLKWKNLTAEQKSAFLKKHPGTKNRLKGHWNHQWKAMSPVKRNDWLIKHPGAAKKAGQHMETHGKRLDQRAKHIVKHGEKLEYKAEHFGHTEKPLYERGELLEEVENEKVGKPLRR